MDNMKQLLVYLKNSKKECFLAPLFKMLEASFELFIPLVIANLIDKGIKNADTGSLSPSCLFIGTITSATNLGSFAAFFGESFAIYR